MVIAALAVVLGVVLLVAAALAWSGQWERWSRQFLMNPMPITLFPGLGAGAIAGGLTELGAIDSVSPLTAVAMLLLLCGAALYFWQPPWWGPAWYRRRGAFAPPDLSDGLTAMAAAAVSPAPGGGSPPPLAGEPIARWTAAWVVGDESAPAAHALTRAGVVQGRLSLHADGLAFRAMGLEERLSGAPVAATIDRAELVGARTVPSGAGPDGAPRPHAGGPRSPWPRLVLDTRRGPYLFDLNFAGRKARKIRETLAL